MFYVNLCTFYFYFFFFNDTATTEIYTLSLHDALPISEPPALLQVPELVERLLDAGGERGWRRWTQFLLISRVVERGREGERRPRVRDQRRGRRPRRLDRAHHVGDRRRRAVQVVDAGAVEPRRGRGQECARHVLGVDEVGRAVPADLEAPSEDGRFHRQGRIGGEPEIAAGSVDRERAEARGANSVLLPVNTRGLLVGHLVDTVVRGRPRRRVVLDRSRRIEARRAEHRRRGGVDHALHLAGRRARHLEDVGGAGDVDRGAAGRVLAAERDLPGGEEDDPPDPVVAHDALELRAVGDVAAHHGEALRRVGTGDHAHAPRVVAQIEHHGPLAGGQQSADHPRADAAERAGDQCCHEGDYNARGVSERAVLP